MSDPAPIPANSTTGKRAPRHAVIRQKVPAFARYEGTSAFRKYRSRVREYNRFKAATAQAAPKAATPAD